MWDQSLTGLSLLSAAMSVALAVAFAWTTRHTPSLQPSVHAADGPELSVIIPARNEQSDIARCLQSLRDQRGVQLEIIVVNDHSTDRTADIVDRIAAADPRVAVIHNPPLRAGWLGKANAMQTGIECATSAYVAFSDADVIHGPDCFASAWEQMQRKEIDFLSLSPLFVCESFWENALLPHCMVAAWIQFFSPRVNDANSDRAAAAGAFMLMHRQVLDRIGGLEPVKTEVLDDVALAKAVKRNGFDARFWLGSNILSVRLFKSNRDAFWGLTKNILASVDRTALALPAMLLPVFVYWIPLATIAAGCWQRSVLMIAAGTSAYLIQLYIVLLSTRICQVRWHKAIFFPAAVAPVFCCFAKALYHRLSSGSVAWRGRVIPVSGR